ncbi:MAG: 16S rRNA (uracil(1498)-N(3))-methyltransferase [Pseudomonadota bacterium]|nr:16S rRNA (uracil(1498)-N(3))-methyltransferase [Pseudomonadota bacterium]MDE3037756.1 16S rRNA (uracil(1498)-N(3))-methyltransferase [Pseudomonadota bacterium]
MLDFCPKIRLYVPQPFSEGEGLVLPENQSHYLAHVMRCREGESIAVFNGYQGEWLAEISSVRKKSVMLLLKKQIAAQQKNAGLWLAFAPIKNKTDLVAEKAVELGVSSLHLVYTSYAVVRNVKRGKLEAHVALAAEQCGRHDVPSIEEHKDIPSLLSVWPDERTLLFADESGGSVAIKQLLSSLPPGKYGVLIGPEGGFSEGERRLLHDSPCVKAFGLGPRILRADTAAVAALACVQAWLGD